MRTEAKVIRSESFPQAKEAFSSDDAHENVGGAAILGLPVDDFHVLNSRLGNVHRHRRDGGD